MIFNQSGYHKVYFLAFLFLLFSAGCKKKDTQDQIIYGSFSVDITVMHHSWNVPNIPVYLKKNADQFPGFDSSVYEYKAIADSDGKAQFEHLYPGKYYLFSKGYDYYFGAEVVGASPLVLNNPDSQNETIQVTIMVSE